MKTRGFYFNMKGIFRDDCMPVGEIEVVISVFPGYWPKLAAELFDLFCFSFQGGEENAGDGTVTQPEITYESEVPDDGAKQEEDHRTPIPNDDTNSVDQAFASYRKENPHLSHKTLQDQLNILSMVG